jgi:hypothetical protein
MSYPRRAQEAAAAVDARLRESCTGSALLVLFRNARPDPEVLPLDGDLLAALQAGAWGSCVVAAVSALGHATDLRRHGEQRERVRVTLAVGCCSTAAVIRRSDDGLISSSEAEGEFCTVLRRAVRLEPCNLCARVGPLQPDTERSLGRS